MQGYWFDYAAAMLACVSAFFWALSAMVKFSFGYDMDRELNAAMTRAAKLNAWAAVFAALAAVVPALKAFGAFKGWIH